MIVVLKANGSAPLVDIVFLSETVHSRMVLSVYRARAMTSRPSSPALVPEDPGPSTRAGKRKDSVFFLIRVIHVEFNHLYFLYVVLFLI